MYCGSPNRNVSTLYHRTVNSILYWNYEIMQMQIMIIEKGLIAEESIVILLANRRKRFIIEHDGINNNYAAIMTCVFACPNRIWICLKESLSASGTLTFWSLRWKRICLDGVSAVLISRTAPSEAKPNFPRIRSWRTNDMLISVPTCSRLQLLGRAKPPCGSTAVLRFSAKCSGSVHTHFRSWSQLNPARRLALAGLVWLDPGFGIYKNCTSCVKYRDTDIGKAYGDRQVSLEVPGRNMRSWSQFNAR